MKKSTFKRLLSLALAATLALSACAIFTSCNNTEEPDNGSSGSDDTTNTSIDYKVSLTDYAGAPARDVIVHVMKDGEEVKMNVTGPTGVAKFSLPSGDYTFTLESADSDKTYSYDESECVLSAQAPEASITLYNGLRSTGKIYFHIDDSEIICDTFDANVGGTVFTVGAGKTAYFIFTPTQQGHYRISASDPSVSVGYHGAPSFPIVNNIADMESDGSFYFNINESNIGTSGTGTSQYIISACAEAETKFILRVEREGNYIAGLADEPWQDIMPARPLSPFVPDTPLNKNMLVNLDITSSDLTVVLNENDGYYHLGSADGPLVLVRITEASDHIVSFVEMCETDRLGAYIYDENGNFVRKESYNELIAKYAEICDEATGVCPLDESLARMIKTVGAHKGWWNYKAGSQIFSGIVVPEENAWLFACCYVAAP